MREYKGEKEKLTASWDRGHADFLDHEKGDFEVSTFGLDVLRVLVVRREIDAANIDEQEVGTSRFDELNCIVSPRCSNIERLFL